MKGWKTIALSAMTTLLGLLESDGITNIVASHPGGIMTGLGVAIGVLRVLTTSPIFKA